MQQMYLTHVVKNLLFINILMFLASLAFGNMNFALMYPGSDGFRSYQIVTHFFMHANFGHILFNMLALVSFGPLLEGTWGPKRFLFYYLFCAIGAAALHTGVQYLQISELQKLAAAFNEAPSFATYNAFFDKVSTKHLNAEWLDAMYETVKRLDNGDLTVAPYIQKGMQDFIDYKMGGGAVGASGAIFGLLVAIGMLYKEMEIGLMFLPIYFKAKYAVPGLIILELFLGQMNFAWDNIAHYAHLGGAFFGFLLIWIWRKQGVRLV